MQVTINDVRYAVNDALELAFPDIPVSNEEIGEVIDSPYFYVRLLEPTLTQELGRRYKRNLPFVIRYFGSDHTSDEWYEMGEKLTTALKWITVAEAQYLGQGMSFQIVDEVLQFFVTFSMLVYAQQPNDAKMQRLEQEEYVI
ncbi:phage tail terminator family protein [Paenibacillus endoradicis]|uniref:phage tail terminator family protein n=1 Tax=Paenibacillus endoradicis TaxID=2972487 RepID=UPI002158AF35|nr:hypothetical protein [Paenibacillus endoradicis]MCR8658957.1 hypothetical protein [Paenibacillus endoradicis]